MASRRILKVRILTKRKEKVRRQVLAKRLREYYKRKDKIGLYYVKKPEKKRIYINVKGGFRWFWVKKEKIPEKYEFDVRRQAYFPKEKVIFMKRPIDIRKTWTDKTYRTKPIDFIPAGYEHRYGFVVDVEKFDFIWDSEFLPLQDSRFRALIRYMWEMAQKERIKPSHYSLARIVVVGNIWYKGDLVYSGVTISSSLRHELENIVGDLDVTIENLLLNPVYDTFQLLEVALEMRESLVKVKKIEVEAEEPKSILAYK